MLSRAEKRGSGVTTLHGIMSRTAGMSRHHHRVSNQECICAYQEGSGEGEDVKEPNSRHARAHHIYGVASLCNHVQQLNHLVVLVHSPHVLL